MHHHRPAHAQLQQSSGKQLGHLGSIHPKHDRTRPGGVAQGSKHIENRANPELAPDHRDIRQHRVQFLRVQKTDAVFTDRVFDHRRRRIEVAAERIQHIGGTASAAGGAVAVLRDRDPGPGGDERAGVEC